MMIHHASVAVELEPGPQELSPTQRLKRLYHAILSQALLDVGDSRVEEEEALAARFFCFCPEGAWKDWREECCS